MDPSVSVIIPTWNAASSVAAALRSALHQTYPPVEVLVCDDGSTDDTTSVVKSIADARIRWLPGSHSGTPAVPRNRGIHESTGEWIAILDADDEWLPDKLKKQLALAKKLGCSAASTNAQRLVPEKGIVGNILDWQNERITFDDLLGINQVICSSAIFHRSLVDIINGFPEAYEIRSFADWATWLRIATQTDFAYVGEPLMIYWDDPSSSLRREDPDVWTQRKIVFGNFLDWTKRAQRVDRSLQLYARKVKQQIRADRQRLLSETQQPHSLRSTLRERIPPAVRRIRRLFSKVNPQR